MEQLIVQGRSTPGPQQKNDQRVRRYPENVPFAPASNTRNSPTP
jgi:hypothetical protein